MNIVPYIFFPLSLGLIVFTYAFFKYPRYAIAGLIIAKPIIDLSWDYNIFLNINFLKLYAGLFVILGVIYIIVKRVPILTSRHSAKNSPFHRFSVSPFHSLTILWLIFLSLNFISTFIISDSTLFVNKIDYILRILNGFVALIIFAHLFDFKKDKKFVLSIFIIAGIFPLLLWLIPVLSGNPIISNDPLRRIIGPYRGFWHFNLYATQTIICCLAYLALSSRHCEPERSEGVAISTLPVIASVARQSHLFRRSRAFRLVKRVVLYLMVLISIVIIYKCYSKSGWITLIVIFLIWFVLQRKFIFASIFVLITVIILSVNPFAKDFQKTFQNEIDYFIHDSDTKEMVFRGRMIRWENGMQDFAALPVLNKLFGSKETIGYPENYYLRVLWDNGITGFMIYVIVLVTTGCFLIKRYIKHKNPIMLGAILVWIFYLLNSIGSSPMLNPAFQWFMWGMVGFIVLEHRNMES